MGHLLLLLLVATVQGGCEFPKAWSGTWFQSGLPYIRVNGTHIDLKGECFEEQGDKYLVFDKTENCYRCMAIHEKHPSVLQYKETFCEPRATFQEICYGITGDAPLYSMFRKHPEARAAPVACPFKGAPFAFSYSRGAGECGNPPSRAESCTDESRLVLRYQACPDVSSTESNVEELVCLATWKEGSTKYLIGKLAQGSRRAMLTDEEQYRCFIYQKGGERGRAVYHVAQSGDATCSGLQSVFEGSRMMTLTAVDGHHNRCKFPAWITSHHTWLSLDHRRTFKFSQRNATLKIVAEEAAVGGADAAEMRLVCHSILQSGVDERSVQIVAHVTAGCTSGFVCTLFHRRDAHVIEIQQSEAFEDSADDACRHFDPTTTPFTTLITTTLHPKKCAHLGRYVVTSSTPTTRRKRRQQANVDLVRPECLAPVVESLAVGCGGAGDTMELRTGCAQQPVTAYTCHASWQDNGTIYAVASNPKDLVRACFIYRIANGTDSPIVMRISAAADSCHRHLRPGVDGLWAYNLTSNGTCDQLEGYNSGLLVMPSALLLATLLPMAVLR